MKAGLRLACGLLAASMAVHPAAALAQDAGATSNTPASDAIGPRDLQTFDLGGTSTRRPEPVVVPPAERPAPSAPATANAAAPAATESPSRTAPPAERRTAVRAAPQEVASAAPEATSSRAAAAPPPTSLQPPVGRSLTFQLPPASDAPVRRAAPTAASDFADPPETSSFGAGQANLIPWILLALLIAGGGIYFVWRQRNRHAFAGAHGTIDAFMPAPSPAPVPAPPRPAAPRPAPPAAAPVGVVSTRLRPWIEIEFTPGRVIFDGDRATLEFEVQLLNSGSAPARDVLIEASLFNAGPDQDAEIARFFAEPIAQGDRLAQIQPLKRVGIASAVTLAGEQLRIFEAADRRFFVPLIGFNALYRWGTGEGQTSASYLVGRDAKGEKMAPFRVDLGPRQFRTLGAREHALHVRK